MQVELVLGGQRSVQTYRRGLDQPPRSDSGPGDANILLVSYRLDPAFIPDPTLDAEKIASVIDRVNRGVTPPGA